MKKLCMNLTAHTNTPSKHYGIKYDCDMCDYQPTDKGNLARLKQSKHDGLSHDSVHCTGQRCV